MINNPKNSILDVVLKRFVRIMKLINLFIIVGICTMNAVESYSQSTQLTLNVKNSTLEKVFKMIEEQSEFVFFYSDEAVDLHKRVSIQVKDQTIDQILDQLLEQTGNSYVIDDRQIFVGSKLSSGKITEFPQSKMSVTGVVVDETGLPIVGATVQIKGTTIGTATNVDGVFELKCAKGDVLLISYIGYEPKEVKVTNLKMYSIELSESAEMLEEVVVTAFGAGQKKESMVGSVAQIRPEELKVPSSSLSSSFAGRMAGVIAVQRSGEPGADGADFWIRGKSTFSGATGALIILDGVEISSSELNALDPEAIEGFSILKDATATALYGTRGANGVMIVTTKSGKNMDKPIINFRLEGAVTQLSQVPEMADGVTYMRAYNEALTRPNSTAMPYSEDKIQGTLLGLNPYIYIPMWIGMMKCSNRMLFPNGLISISEEEVKSLIIS